MAQLAGSSERLTSGPFAKHPHLLVQVQTLLHGQSQNAGMAAPGAQQHGSADGRGMAKRQEFNFKSKYYRANSWHGG